MRLASSIDKKSFALTIRIPIRLLHLGIAFVQDRDDLGANSNLAGRILLGPHPARSAGSSKDSAAGQS